MSRTMLVGVSKTFPATIVTLLYLVNPNVDDVQFRFIHDHKNVFANQSVRNENFTMMT